MPTSTPKADSGKAPVFKFFIGSKSKVRTGCITCKIRRIKCDEKKPACNRCITTGRKCDGYAAEPSRKKIEVARVPPTTRKPRKPPIPTKTIIKPIPENIPRKIPEHPECDSNELRLLHFFERWSVAAMSSYKGGKFWSYHVPQVAHFEPSVRHAVIAMAATHEQVAFMRDGIPNDPRLEESICQKRTKLALFHYNKSISLLAKLLAERGNESESVALVNCILFVMIDFIFGNIETAMFHLHSGREIMKRRKQRNLKSEPPTEKSLEGGLVYIFGSMNLPSARRFVESIALENAKLIDNRPPNESHGQNVKLCPDLRAKQDAHMGKLEIWRFKFERLLRARGPNFTPEVKEEIASIRLLYLSAVILIWACDCPQQQENLMVFSRLIDVAEELVTSFGNYGKTRPRIVHENICDERVRPAYSIIASRSSDPVIKKRALALLEKTSVEYHLP
ncbi:hypothetical protein G7Y89_g8144 [Cudoniella acicularis]|uniref:Zn(2)-C6 fungal-type domain-containing protein n=1 Tax=Cudoniella acicularis TaxID=354080 RepID=A0A8H4W1C9_9HELO|nr:hypothetical protein G7Y89_g8144 [Cudoniella acicularis]